MSKNLIKGGKKGKMVIRNYEKFIETFRKLNKNLINISKKLHKLIKFCDKMLKMDPRCKNCKKVIKSGKKYRKPIKNFEIILKNVWNLTWIIEKNRQNYQNSGKNWIRNGSKVGKIDQKWKKIVENWAKYENIKINAQLSSTIPYLQLTKVHNFLSLNISAWNQ